MACTTPRLFDWMAGGGYPRNRKSTKRRRSSIFSQNLLGRGYTSSWTNCVPQPQMNLPPPHDCTNLWQSCQSRYPRGPRIALTSLCLVLLIITSYTLRPGAAAKALSDHSVWAQSAWSLCPAFAAGRRRGSRTTSNSGNTWQSSLIFLVFGFWASSGINPLINSIPKPKNETGPLRVRLRFCILLLRYDTISKNKLA